MRPAEQPSKPADVTSMAMCVCLRFNMLAGKKHAAREMHLLNVKCTFEKCWWQLCTTVKCAQQALTCCVAVLLQLLYANYVTWQLSMTVHIASEMRFNALHGLTQPCLTAWCTWCNTSMTHALHQALQSSVSLEKCLWDTIKEVRILANALEHGQAKIKHTGLLHA